MFTALRTSLATPKCTIQNQFAVPFFPFDRMSYNIFAVTCFTQSFSLLTFWIVREEVQVSYNPWTQMRRKLSITSNRIGKLPEFPGNQAGTASSSICCLGHGLNGNTTWVLKSFKTLKLVAFIQKHFLKHSARLAHPCHLVSRMLTGRCRKCEDIRKLVTWICIQI